MRRLRRRRVAAVIVVRGNGHGVGNGRLYNLTMGKPRVLLKSPFNAQFDSDSVGWVMSLLERVKVDSTLDL